MSKLKEKLDSIVDGYYLGSDDYRDLVEILEEVEFLHSRGILEKKNLGRTHDIVTRVMKEV